MSGTMRTLFPVKLCLVLALSAPAACLHNAALPSSAALRPPQQRLPSLRGGRSASGLSGFAAGDALMAEQKVPMKVESWSVGDVETWLKASGMSDIVPMFHKHQVDGNTLLELNEDRIQRLGIEIVSRQIKTVAAVQHLQKCSKMPARLKIHVPQRWDAWKKFLTCRFLLLSEGKSGDECKEELIQANSNMALISALMLGVTMSWAFGATNTCFCDKVTGKACYCSSGFDLDGKPLWTFFSCSMIASVIFSLCTISAVVQILAVQECSDDHEVLVFFDKLGVDEVLCGPLMILGISFSFLAMAVYIIFTEKLGIFHNYKNVWSWGTAAACLALCAVVVPKWINTSQKLYAAKLYAAYHPEKKHYVSGVEHPSMDPVMPNVIPSLSSH